MRMIAGGSTGRRAALAAALLALATTLLIGGVARAGTWIQVTCKNPNGTSAPAQGWSTFTTGTPSFGSAGNANCDAGHQLTAILSDMQPAPVGGGEVLQYAPPAGSTLIGGTLQVGLAGDGYGTDATGAAALMEPDFQEGADVFFSCVHIYGPCHDGTDVYIGPLSLPRDRGGDLFIESKCDGGAGAECNTGGSYSAWATAGVPWAHLLLSNSATPQTNGEFSGSALQPNIRGTGHLVFTASDVGGPGIYRVTAFVDGRVVWAGTPNTNGGLCVPVGIDASAGALEFDGQQPCPVTEVDDVPVPTTGLSNGGHELTVAVVDAADNTSVVFDQQITTSNPQSTPVPHDPRALHVVFTILWRWRGAVTRMLSVKVKRMPSGGHVSVTCLGRGCPRLRVRSGSGRGVRRVLSELVHARFRAGDRLRITVTKPGRGAERIQVLIRNGRKPRPTIL